MALRRALLWCLLAALLAAPALAHLHRTLHGPHADLAHAATAQAHAGDHDHAHGWIERLFAAHDDDSSCRLYDQLSQTDALPGVPLLAFPLVLTPFLFRRLDRDAVARWAALFDARGPPALR